MRVENDGNTKPARVPKKRIRSDAASSGREKKLGELVTTPKPPSKSLTLRSNGQGASSEQQQRHRRQATATRGNAEFSPIQQTATRAAPHHLGHGG